LYWWVCLFLFVHTYPNGATIQASKRLYVPAST
jgi:hypothetical protein